MRRPDRTTSLLLLLIALNAVSLFVFRFFISLDGPMHVLHACVTKAAWSSGRYHTPEVDYLVNPGTLDLSDLVLIPLTRFLSPMHAHTAYAVFVMLVLCIGTLCMARAAGIRNAALFLWVLPLAFSYVFVLGFFTFLLASGFALMAGAWWMARGHVRWRTLFFALLWMLGCQGVHRSGGTMAILIMGCYELLFFARDRTGWRARWAAIPPRWRYIVTAFGLAVAAWKVGVAITVQPRVVLPTEQDRWQELLSGRPLLLFGRATEQPWLVLLGALLIGTVVIALVYRSRTRNVPVAVDAIGLVIVLLLLASVVFHTRNAQLLYMSIRSQTIALLLVPAWVAGVVPRNWWSTVLGTAVLVIHIARMVCIEDVMAWSQRAFDGSQEVVAHLPLHGVALPLVQDDDWLHEHLSAFVAASYEGVFFSPCDHLGFKHRTKDNNQLRDYSSGFRAELVWLEHHVATHALPVIDHIVLFGQGKPPDPCARNLLAVMHRHYVQQWKNDYAEVWVLDR